MKKLFPLLALCLFVFAACEPDPVLSLDKEVIEFDAAGGSQTVAVSANNTWNTLSDEDEAFYSISPSAGEGNGYITVTVKPNTTTSNLSGQFAIICSSRSTSVTKTVRVSQTCPVGDAVMEGYVMDPPDNGTGVMAAEGGTISLHIQGNAPWDLQCDGSERLDAIDLGNYAADVVATIAPCPTFEGRTIKFTLTCRTASGSNTHTYEFSQAGGIVVYGGEVYHAAKMKDGKWWMTENLRYIPSGMTPTDDLNAVTNGIWYPLVINVLTPDAASVKFSTDPADIKANGYLYNTETALGLKTGDLTAENCKNYEGVQGICPAGWHIPTRAEIIALVGKTSDKNDTNPNAPYYDAELNGGNGSVALLNADGFNAGAWGAVSIANSTIAKASTMGAVKSYQGGMNTGYIAGSSLVDTGKNLTTLDDGSLKNCQFMGLMPFMGNGTYNGALNNYRNGVSVRCVKNN